MTSFLPIDELCFLNRIALVSDKNIANVQYKEILEQIFQNENPINLKRKLFRFSLFALQSKTEINLREVPEAIYCFQTIEVLIECCYLVKNAAGSSKYFGKLGTSNLSGYNIDPFEVILEFFRQHKIGDWKKIVNYWSMAAISNHSIVEEIAPEEILISYEQFSKIIDASFSLYKQTSFEIHEEQSSYHILKVA